MASAGGSSVTARAFATLSHQRTSAFDGHWALAAQSLRVVAPIPGKGTVGVEVPNAVREWMAVGDEQYLSMKGMGQFTDFPDRALNRMQIELVAGRVSSYNECFY